MAIQVRNSAVLSFGTFGAAATVTHIRVRLDSNTGEILLTETLGSPIQVAQNQILRIPINGLDLRFLKGEMEDGAVRDAWERQFDAQDLVVQAMTSNSAVVAVAGYSDVTITRNTGLTYNTVADAG